MTNTMRKFTLPPDLTNVLFHCAENCVFQLVYPEAFSLKIESLKKLFRYMFSEISNPDNVKAIKSTEKAIDILISENKVTWEAASQAYQNGYVDVKFRYGLTVAQKKRNREKQ